MIHRNMDRRTFLSHTAVAAAATALPGFAHAADSPLSRHRIDRIEFRTVSIPWPRQVGRKSSKGIHGHGPAKLRVCVLHTDQGATGWGQTQGKTGKPEQLLELVQGKTVAELIDPAPVSAPKSITPSTFPSMTSPVSSLINLSGQ